MAQKTQHFGLGIGVPLASSTFLQEETKSNVILKPYSELESIHVERESIEKGLVSTRITFWEDRRSNSSEKHSRSGSAEICGNVKMLLKKYETYSSSGAHCSHESISSAASVSEPESSSSGVVSMSNSNSDQESRDAKKTLLKQCSINMEPKTNDEEERTEVHTSEIVDNEDTTAQVPTNELVNRNILLTEEKLEEFWLFLIHGQVPVEEIQEIVNQIRCLSSQECRVLLRRLTVKVSKKLMKFFKEFLQYLFFITAFLLLTFLRYWSLM